MHACRRVRRLTRTRRCISVARAMRRCCGPRTEPMHFEGEFSVPGRPDDVIRRFADVERMARCMPGAAIEGRDEEGNYLGSMLVAFGPKKIRFRGRVTVETDRAAHTGSLRGRGAADMRAARIELRIAYALRDDPATLGATMVKLT